MDQDRLYDTAAEWHARIDAGDVDWDAFAGWLDADDAHQAAYDHVAQVDHDVSQWATAQGLKADLDPVLSEPGAEQHDRRRRWWLAGTAVAATAVAALSIPALLHRPAAPTIYETGRSEQRDVTLADGSSVRLDRGTRIAVAGGSAPRIAIEAGAAYFSVRHDPSRAFVVQSGDYIIRDIGTRFGVTRRGASLSVAVEEGAVEVAWRDSPATLVRAGRSFEAGSGDAGAVLGRIDTGSVSSWRSGRLIYDNAPLALVAADASRYSSTPISVDPAVADLKLSGVLLIGDGSHLVDQVQAFLPVQVRRHGDRLELVGRSRRP